MSGKRGKEGPTRAAPDPGCRDVFITGGTGFMGRALIAELVVRGFAVRALVRRGSERKLPAGCEAVPGDPLDGTTFADSVHAADTFVQLVGISNPSPWTARRLKAVDLVSVRESVKIATAAAVRHFVYVSVAHPAPVMRAYIDVRRQGESLIRAADFNATILQPWYVLGPGRRWPILLKPLYWMAEGFPPTREGARRLGLITRDEMVSALAEAVEKPAEGIRVMTVEDIRASHEGRGGA